ncbi:putative baseplate assembly protein [Leptospira phage LE4]|uniref:Putative baseplate assembly protein n=1 Tax=Leptospira phage LE4 TaxID=2041383 RepID=A0A343LEE4_9CAUD|nr:putative baseplate assembly protein [Leptospira phage LE4]ATN95054.1 putative baseplate assembly protein [Leptospira phage LE4]
MSNKKVIQYSTKDFLTALADIESDPELRKFPARFKRLHAGTVDAINNNLNAVFNSIILRTAFSRPILQDILQLIDYQMSWKKTSVATIQITVVSSATPYVILKADCIFGTAGTVDQASIQFESREDIAVPALTTLISRTVYSQTTQPQRTIGVTDGSNFQEIDLPDLDILPETLFITINGNQYDLVDSFAESASTDRHFRIYFRSDGSSYIQLPGVDQVDNTSFGQVPPQGQTVYANYATGGGANTNVSANTITEYLGTDSNIVSVNNGSPASGGLDEETIQNAVTIAPLRARTTRYFINRSTGVAVAKEIDGVLYADIVKVGALSCECYIIPVGGGIASSQLLQEVEDLLVSRSPLEEIEVNAYTASYLTTFVNMQIKLLPGFSYADVAKFSSLAVCQTLHVLGQYIFEVYASNGVQSAIEEINSIYGPIIGYTFTIADSSGIIQILGNVETAVVSKPRKISEIYMALGFVQGLDYANIVAPNSDLVPNNGSITNVSTVTLTQVN